MASQGFCLSTAFFMVLNNSVHAASVRRAIAKGYKTRNEIEKFLKNSNVKSYLSPSYFNNSKKHPGCGYFVNEHGKFTLTKEAEREFAAVYADAADAAADADTVDAADSDASDTDASDTAEANAADASDTADANAADAVETVDANTADANAANANAADADAADVLMEDINAFVPTAEDFFRAINDNNTEKCTNAIKQAALEVTTDEVLDLRYDQEFNRRKNTEKYPLKDVARQMTKEIDDKMSPFYQNVMEEVNDIVNGCVANDPAMVALVEETRANSTELVRKNDEETSAFMAEKNDEKRALVARKDEEKRALVAEINAAIQALKKEREDGEKRIAKEEDAARRKIMEEEEAGIKMFEEEKDAALKTLIDGAVERTNVLTKQLVAQHMGKEEGQGGEGR